MRFLFAGAMAAVAVMAAAPQVSQAAVFAAHLNMEDNGDGTYSLSYRLNEEANQGVVINIKDSTDTVVRSISYATQSKGLQTVTWDGLDNSLAAVPDGTYTWEVVASTNNPGSDEYVETVAGTAPEHMWGAPYTAAINKNTASPYFGTVYIGNGVATENRGKEAGLYVLSNDLADHTEQGSTSYKGNANFQYPWAIAVAPDGDLFITDYIDEGNNVWIADPSDLNGDFSPLFDNTGQDTIGLNSVHGSIYSLHVEGEGEDRVLYTFDEDMGNAGSVWQYDIGTVESGYSTPPTVVYDDGAHNNLIQNWTGEIHKDTNPNRSGWFLSQTRWTDASGVPSVLHYDGTTVDWKSATALPVYFDQNYDSSFDLNADSTRLVAVGINWVQVVDISDLAGVDESSVIYDDTGHGSVWHRDVRFDAAENFILLSSTTDKVTYYSKTGPNTFITPNPEGAAINIGATSVESWELY